MQSEDHNVFDRHRKKCPRIKAQIFNHPYEVLIDSGAELSCISADLFNQINVNNLIPTLPVTGVTVLGATGSKARNVKKQAFITLDFGDNQCIETCFLVVEGLLLPIILGSDWLDEYDAALGFKNKSLIICVDGNIIRLNTLTESDQESSSQCVNYIGARVQVDQDLVHATAVETERFAPPTANLSSQLGQDSMSCASNQHGSRELCSHLANLNGDATHHPHQAQSRMSFDIVVDRDLMSTSSEGTNLSNAIILSRIMSVKLEKLQASRVVQQLQQEPTPFKIRELVKENKTLTNKQKRKLSNILIKNIKVFSSNPGYVKGFEYDIKVNDTTPFKCMSYPIPLAYQSVTDAEIKRMLELRIIRKQATPFINPLVPVIKKDGTVRLCLDARRTNKIIIPDYDSPMPPEEILQKFSGKKFLSTFDLTSAFWQIPISEGSKQFTGFLYQGQSYVFNVIPFGLCVSMAALNRCLNQLLGPEILDHTTIYVDDLLCASNTFDLHCTHINMLLQRLCEIGMTVKLSKTLLCRNEVPFLGMILTPQGIKPDERKLQAILEFPRPTDKKSLQGFTGTCGYLQRFTEKYAQTVSPLYKLLQNNTAWEWTEEHENAFKQTKQLFKEVCMLFHPVAGKRYFIESDASLSGIAALLYHIDNNDKHIISCVSRSLKPAEKNYTVSELELLAIQWSLSKFRYFVANAPLTIRTDHKALSFLTKCRLLNARLTRYILAIQDYNFEIEHIPGVENKWADILSRNTPQNSLNTNKNYSCEQNDILIAPAIITDNKINIPELKSLPNFQEKDTKLNDIRTLILDPHKPLSSKRHENIISNYIIYENILFQKHNELWKACIPNSLINTIVKSYHEYFGHFGPHKILHKISEQFIWPRMRRDIRRIIAGCDVCQKSKSLNCKYIGESQSNIPRQPGECVAIDIFGPLPRAQLGMQYVLVLIDVFSKFVVFYALKTATAKSILNKIIYFYIPTVNKPLSILSDNASQFTSKEFQTTLEKEGIKLKHSAIYTPTSNPAERPLKDTGRIIRAYCHDKHTTWLKVLPKIARWINITVCETTGFTPFELQHGRAPENELKQLINFPPSSQVPVKPIEMHIIARERMNKAAKKRQERANKSGTILTFKKDDLVLVKSHRLSNLQNKEMSKFFLLYEGPFKVLNVIGPTTYAIANIDGDQQLYVHNIKNLKPYVKPVV